MLIKVISIEGILVYLLPLIGFKTVPFFIQCFVLLKSCIAAVHNSW